MQIKLRKLNVVDLVIRLCEELIINYSLNFNDFIITLNNNNNKIIIINQLK